MTDPITLVSTLITELKGELSQLARELKNRAEWDLSCPVVVVDARQNPRRVVATTVRGITGVITTSRTIDHPLMRVFLVRHKEIGAEAAVNEFLAGPDGEEFAEVWDAYVVERDERGLACWSHDDAAKFATKSKNSFDRRELACVAIAEGEGNEDVSVLTFSVDANWLS